MCDEYLRFPNVFMKKFLDLYRWTTPTLNLQRRYFHTIIVDTPLAAVCTMPTFRITM